MVELRNFIRFELKQLLSEAQASEEEVDDVFLDYVEGILDPENEEEEDIVPTLVAYVPALGEIPEAVISRWFDNLRVRCKRLAGGRKHSEPSSSTSQDKGFSLKVDDSALAPKKEGSGIDPTLKDSIVNKHALVGEAASGEYRPTLPPKPTEHNTKIRYFNGQVVNTKGHRFIEPKKEESEEMKKTYINLKPAKQYRFH